MHSHAICTEAAACGPNPNADQLNLVSVILMIPKDSSFQLVIGLMVASLEK